MKKNQRRRSVRSNPFSFRFSLFFQFSHSLVTETVFSLQTNFQREAFQLEMCVSIFINLINGCTIKILVTEVLALAKTS